jgi:hypothetical protein
MAQTHSRSAAFRKAGGRVVILRRSPETLKTAEACAVSEGLVGFARSLAQENGRHGATVNILCDASSAGDAIDACDAPLEWLLSAGSCYVTGQELAVVRSPPYSATQLEEEARSAALITGAARGPSHHNMCMRMRTAFI